MNLERTMLENMLMIKNYSQHDTLPGSIVSRKEIGELGVWSLNSAKQGNGILQLRDNSTETFWQSDGPIPHLIDIQFLRKTAVSHVALYLDYKTDESYTPEVISIRGGIHMNNLREIVQVKLKEPSKWYLIPLKQKGDLGTQAWIYTLNLQVAVLQMHHSGKDTHIRQVKVFGHPQDGGARSKKVGHFQFNDAWQYLR